MDLVEIIGVIAGILTTISFIPQVYLIYKTKETKDLSLGMFSLFTIGVFLWLVYGLIKGSLAMIFANGLTFILSLYILIMKLKYK